MPSARNIADIKSNLLHPATTSHFEVKIPFPAGLPQPAQYWRDNGVVINQDKLQLLCSEATLPGSSLATLELTNDHTGVTERHAYRRVYDDRIDLTFYVDAENYNPIRFFETWIKYTAGESIAGTESIKNDNYNYRFRYRDSYVAKSGLEVIKFEKSTYAYDSKYNYKKRGTLMVYKFVNAFPISISSMPVSYDSSSLLKCTVSMSYIRYYIDRADENVLSDALTPIEQAKFNTSNLTLPGLDGLGALTTGGVPLSVANASGNTIDRRVEAGLPGVGRNNFVERSIFGP